MKNNLEFTEAVLQARYGGSTELEGCLRCILNEIMKNPDDSIVDIANEAFNLFNVRLEARWSHRRKYIAVVESQPDTDKLHKY